ncbi:MAG: hypothetical protein V1793_14025 [Pseudomonadota bacterium]
MKITKPDVIRAGEKDLIDAVKADLDWSAVREIVKKNITRAALQSRGGEIVVHNNQIAFRIDLALNLNVSLMFGRDGTYIPDNDGDAGDTEPTAQAVSLQLTDDSLAAGFLEDDPGQDSADTSMDLLFEDDVPDASESDLELDPGEGLDVDGIDLNGDDLLLGAGDASDSGATGEHDLDLDALSLLDDEAGVGDGEESMDKEIDEILKESRAFWEQKKDEPNT